MSLDDTTKKITTLFAIASGFSDTLTFDFGADGIVSVNGKIQPPEVSNDTIDSDCTISIALEDFISILDGALDPQMAFMSGKLSVEGNMGIAMNLASVLKP
ncbi:MAG: SCP2 sterol-binding domain-containing protein [Sphingomonadales bacterium]